MNCQKVRTTISEYLGGTIPEGDREVLQLHLAECRECSRSSESSARLREALLNAQRYSAPAKLSTNLRVLASKELARQSARQNWEARFADLRSSFKVWVDNMMRPIAIPFAGGLASAIVLFGTFVPTFARVYTPINDVPAGWYTSATLDALGPFGMAEECVVLDVTIDDQGRMVDYSIPGGKEGPWENEALRRSVVNNLLFTRFTPANFFGVPTYGKVRVMLRRSQVDVRG